MKRYMIKCAISLPLVLLLASVSAAGTIQEYCKGSLARDAKTVSACIESEEAAKKDIKKIKTDGNVTAFCEKSFPESYVDRKGCIEDEEAAADVMRNSIMHPAILSYCQYVTDNSGHRNLLDCVEEAGGLVPLNK